MIAIYNITLCSPNVLLACNVPYIHGYGLRLQYVYCLLFDISIAFENYIHLIFIFSSNFPVYLVHSHQKQIYNVYVRNTKLLWTSLLAIISYKFVTDDIHWTKHNMVHSSRFWYIRILKFLKSNSKFLDLREKIMLLLKKSKLTISSPFVCQHLRFIRKGWQIWFIMGE